VPGYQPLLIIEIDISLIALLALGIPLPLKGGSAKFLLHIAARREIFYYLCGMTQKLNIAIFASGSGTNCENIIRYFRKRENVNCALVVSNKPDALVLERAQRLGVPSEVVTRAELNDPEVMMPLMRRYGIDFIVLAGFLPLVPVFLIDAYPHRMVNLHPALLPKFCGKGMWGHHVHEAVKAAGETETGMTVHWVTPVLDDGGIIAQYRVALSPSDSADDIAAKEHALEMEHFPRVIDELLQNTFPTPTEEGE